MANTFTAGTGISSAWRSKYFAATLQQVLRKALVAEKICQVDRSDSKYIDNPYSGQPTATVHGSLAGSYSVSTFAVTNDVLKVNLEVIYSEHVYDFEQKLTAFDMFATRVDEMSYAIAWGIDKYVLNYICDVGTGAYTTPSGGFTTSANIPIIISNLVSKVAGYADFYKGLFLVVENTDVPGIMQAQMSSGFSFADSALNNGFMTNYGGVDIYVIRTGTFVSATVGDKTFTNSGHRVFGVKNVAVYAQPQGVQYEEKSVSGKTGKEIVAYGYLGCIIWTQKQGLIVDITLA